MSDPRPSPSATGAALPTIPWGPFHAGVFLVASQFLEIFWVGLVIAVTGLEELTIPWTLVALLGLWSAYGAGSLAAAQKLSGTFSAGLESLGLGAAAFRAGGPARLIGIGVAVGVGMQLIVVPVVYLVLSPLIDTESVEEVARDLVDSASGGLDRVLLVLMVVAIAPVVEELAFRGFIVGGIGRRFRVLPTVLISGALFALVHLQPVTWPGLAVFGFVLALLRLRFDSLVPAIAAHVAFNAVTVIVLLGDVDLPY